MTLRGTRQGLFQGCDGHGFWLDADVIAHTGLARGVDEAALARKREDVERVEAEREATLRAEQGRAEAKADKARREQAAAGQLDAYLATRPPAPVDSRGPRAYNGRP